jgi:hypothetical protein
MANHRRDRPRRPARRQPFREPKPVILVVCEGERTEPEYFEGFAKAYRKLVTIRIAPEHGVPRSLVTIAKSYKKEAEDAAGREGDENQKYDSVWCVFDVDDHPQVADALRMARDNGIKLAISNPCLELWLLLHFRDSPGMQHRGKIGKMLSKYVTGYDKGVQFTVFAAGYQQAVTRAKRMDQSDRSPGDLGGNPTTRVYKPTEEIRASGESVGR